MSYDFVAGVLADGRPVLDNLEPHPEYIRCEHEDLEHDPEAYWVEP